MEHITEHAWTDYVRGIATPETQTVIESHLAAGCEPCRSAALLWQSLLDIATREHDYAPPAGVVRVAESQLAGAQHVRPPRRLLARLIFDSFAQPLPVGVRSGAPMARQLLYESDGLTVDLRIDKHANSKALSIVGQVLDARTLRLAHEAVPVALLDGQGKRLQQTSTSHFGEFHLEIAGETEMQLAIEVDGGRSICIPLPRTACDQASDFGEQNGLPGRAGNDYTGK